MTLLSPHIAYDPAETTLSYAARLACFHTGQPFRRLVSDFGIRAVDFEGGDPEAVKTFAGLAGEADAVLQRGAIRLQRGYNLFRGEMIDQDVMTPRIAHYCPQCLEADGDVSRWKCRIFWCFRSVTVCPEHCCPLVESDGAPNVLDLRDAIDHPLKIGRSGPNGPAVALPDWQAWLNGRLIGVQDRPWLADQTIGQILTASAMMGGVLSHGHRVRLSDLSREESSAATETGFRFYRQGPDAIRSALDDIRRMSSARAVQSGPLAMYGKLFDWLDRRANLLNPGPIRTILREHILEHTAIRAGEMLLGEVVEERRLHSVLSLSEHLGIPRKRMSRLLQKLGLVPEGATDAESGMLVFPVDQAEALCREFETAIPLLELADYLGASKRQALALYAAGTILPLIPPDGRGSVRKVVFARSHLDDFLSRIGVLGLIPNEGCADIVGISTACQRMGGTTAELVQAILDGKIDAWRDPEQVGLRSVVVSLLDWGRISRPEA